MKKLLIYIAAFAMILAMNTSCEDMGSLGRTSEESGCNDFYGECQRSGECYQFHLFPTPS